MRRQSVTIKNKLGVIKEVEIDDKKNENNICDLLGILNKNTCFDIFKDCQLEIDDNDKVPLMHLVTYKFKYQRW